MPLGTDRQPPFNEWTLQVPFIGYMKSAVSIILQHFRLFLSICPTKKVFPIFVFELFHQKLFKFFRLHILVVAVYTIFCQWASMHFFK